MPFGAVAAVFAWDRIGVALQAIIAKVILVLLTRFVDDLFGAEFGQLAGAARSHVVEFVGLLGFSLSPEKTPVPAEDLDILGVDCCVRDQESISLRLDSIKAGVWLEQLLEFSRGQRCRASAAKIAGRFAFSAWAVLGSRIRAKLAGLYALVSQGSCQVPKEDLDRDIGFLIGLVRDRESSVEVPYFRFPGDTYVIFTDAEGHGGVGAVLLTSSTATARSRGGRVPWGLTRALAQRKTQIVAFELVVPGAAVWSWGVRLAGCRIVFYIDNDSALGILRCGRSRKPDLNQIAFVTWELLHRWGIWPVFMRVPSEDNCADPVSRGDPAPFGSSEEDLIWPSFF